jgi:hypothetical protein
MHPRQPAEFIRRLTRQTGLSGFLYQTSASTGGLDGCNQQSGLDRVAPSLVWSSGRRRRVQTSASHSGNAPDKAELLQRWVFVVTVRFHVSPSISPRRACRSRVDMRTGPSSSCDLALCRQRSAHQTRHMVECSFIREQNGVVNDNCGGNNRIRQFEASRTS